MYRSGPTAIGKFTGFIPVVKSAVFLFFIFNAITIRAAGEPQLVLKKTLKGGLSPKSVVCNGNGLFFAQNMMYNHTISVYDNQYRLRKTISDHIVLSDYGFEEYQEKVKGAPVECAFSADGRYAYVSNYIMSGEGFEKPGCDTCSGKDYDASFIYKIDTRNLKIVSVIKAGSVPKYLAVSPDGNYLLVSNWSSADVSLIDLQTEKEQKRIRCGKFPRGIAIDSKSKYAYVAIMGGSHLMRIDLEDQSVEKFMEIGRGPRHLCIDAKDSMLYVTLNHEGNIARINLATGETDKLFVGGTPRSMVLGSNDQFLYVVNYSGKKITKINLKSFSISETAETGQSPIGITYDPYKAEIWVACYSGSLMVFEDKEASKSEIPFADLETISESITDFYSSAITILTPKKSTYAAIEPVKAEEVPVKKEIVPEPKKTKPVVAKTSEPEKKPVPEPVVTTGNYFVVVGSFKSRDNAERKTGSMKNLGYSCSLLTNPKNGFYYAAVGGYSSKAEAESMMKTLLSKNNVEGWVYANQ